MFEVVHKKVICFLKSSLHLAREAPSYNYETSRLPASVGAGEGPVLLASLLFPQPPHSVGHCCLSTFGGGGGMQQKLLLPGTTMYLLEGSLGSACVQSPLPLMNNCHGFFGKTTPPNPLLGFLTCHCSLTWVCHSPAVILPALNLWDPAGPSPWREYRAIPVGPGRFHRKSSATFVYTNADSPLIKAGGQEQPLTL